MVTSSLSSSVSRDGKVKSFRSRTKLEVSTAREMRSVRSEVTTLSARDSVPALCLGVLAAEDSDSELGDDGLE